MRLSSSAARGALKVILLSSVAALPARAADNAGSAAQPTPAAQGVPTQLAQNTQTGQVQVADANVLSDQTQVDTVLVTARYSKEDVSKVPIAITVVSGDQLESANIFTLSKVTQLVPSLQIQGINPRNQTVAIRGLGANPGLTTEGFEPGVGLYIDDVYYARPASVLFDLFDLDDVEVLRGPQGTLFGKNTTAGAVSVTTRAPSFDWGSEAAVSYGNYDFKQLQGSVTGPLTDNLAFRLTLGDTTRDDTIKTTNPNVRNTGLHDQSARLQFLYDASDDLSLRLIGDYNHQNFTGPHQVVASALPRTLANGSTVKNFFDHSADAGYFPQPPIATDPFARESDINSPNFWNQDSHGVSLQANWKLPDDGWLSGDTLTSVTAWREFELFPQYDSDYSGTEYYQTLYIHIRQSQFSQELRLSSTGPRDIDYTVGLYGFWQKSPVDSHSVYGANAAQFAYGPTTSPLLLQGLDAQSLFGAWGSSASAFGQATWHIDDQWSLLAGLRYTYEDKYGYDVSSPAGTYAPISALPVAQQATAAARRTSVAPSYNYTARWNGGTPSGTISLNYQADQDVLVYGTYSRGFQGAGLNLAGVPSTTPTVVAPEYVDSYEVGTKTKLLGNQLTLNGDLFWTNVSNYQATIFDTSLGGRTYIANAGSVRSRGAEIDLRAVPLEGFSLSLSGIYDDASYTSLQSTTCPYLTSYQASCSLTGLPLAGVSKWSATATAEYAHRVLANVEGYIGGDWLARSSFYSQLNDDPYSKVPGYGTLDLHAGIRSYDGRWDFSLWSRNVLDQNYYTVVTPSKSMGYVTAALGDPRFFGATLRVKF